MKRLLAGLLWAAGFVALLFFASVRAEGGQGRFTWQIGAPSPWLTWEQWSQGYQYRTNPFSLSFGLGPLSAALLYGAWRVGQSQTDTPPKE